MQHLTLEALARLVDENAAAEEAAHLDACAACRAELDELRRQSAALGRLGPVEPAGSEWQTLEARLEHEGLLARATSSPVRRAGGSMPGGRWGARFLRLAAALALYGVGTATGMALRARPAASPVTRQAAPPLATSAAPVRAEPPAAEPEPVAQQDTPDRAAPASSRLVSDAEPRTPAEATRALRDAEAAYVRAYANYSQMLASRSPQQQDEDLIARTAALESIALTTRAALDRAPADPVINGYHLTAVAQRDAALRQIALRSKDGRWF
ncbi:MAG TPA: hypothetical protein VF832_13540 [Longimicrobiales bacterium]